MSLFPFHKSLNVEEIKKDLPIYKEVAWDFKTNSPIIENGEIKVVEKNEAIKVWCYKAILTERFTYEIYSWDYGSEVNTLLGRNYAKGLKNAEVKRYIEEALSINSYILEITIKDIIFKDNKLSVNINLKTVYSDEVSLKVEL